jgi:hypothetical protein
MAMDLIIWMKITTTSKFFNEFCLHPLDTKFRSCIIDAPNRKELTQ